MRRLLLAVLLAAGCATAPPAAPEFRAGVAVVDLCPTRNVPLGGYGARWGRPMTGIHDPVTAKALWLETGDTRVCIVTTDLIGSLLAIRDRIKPDDASLVLTASHSHSGPGALVKGFWELAMGRYDEALYEEIVGKLKDVVARARAAARPARIAFARDVEPALQRNRRSKDGPLDPEVHVLSVVDDYSRPIAVLTNYTAHATVLSDKNFLMSGDWPGAFQRALEARLPGAVALYVNGAEGDVAPRAPSGDEGFERCRAIGEALAARVENMVRGIANTTGGVRLSYVERGVDLPSPTLRSAPTRSVLGLLQINGTRFFCFPGEPAADLGLELKKRFPGSWVVGLANDHLGYFLSEQEYARGGYERQMSFYGPTLGPWLVGQLMELGERGHAPDRTGQPEGRSR